jgi:hypothetical protein
MKTIFLLLLSAILACGGDKPTVDVYLIRKYDSKAAMPEDPEVILEIANTTDKTVYVFGSSIENPMHRVEAKRGDRWLQIPTFLCGTGSSSYPLRPGTKMLVTVAFPWEESAARFRFFFFSSPDTDRSKVESVWSRGIEKKELGDLFGTVGELTSDKKLEAPERDEDTNKRITPSDPKSEQAAPSDGDKPSN